MLADQSLQVLVVDFLLLVGHIEEALVEAVERIALVIVAQRFEALMERGMARSGGEDD